MKKINCLFLALFLLLFISSESYSQQKDALQNSMALGNGNRNIYQPAEFELDSILIIAGQQISSFINDIPQENLNEYGFISKNDFKKISFGTPIAVYRLENSYIIFTSTWRVPIIVDNEYRSLLTIIKKNYEYQAVDFGAKVLAHEFSTKKTQNTIGLLRVYELQSDFVINEFSDDHLLFIPIRGEKGESYHIDDIINMLKNR